MTRLSKSLEDLGRNNEAALICFITAGDPDIGMTEQLVVEMDRAGVDAIELGIPFTDPLADGKTIQEASERALAHTITIDTVLSSVKKLRKTTDVPIVLMTYCNPVMQYGIERFASQCGRSGVDGVIITDLPPEEGGEWIKHARKNEVNTIFLLSPTSTAERMESVGRQATGFIYCVARIGVTGAQQSLPTDLKQLVRKIRQRTDKPIGVGFGISQPEHIRSIVNDVGADAVIVGSALINLIQDSLKAGKDPLEVISKRVAQLKKATRRNG